jgi:hypothetical protein
MNPDESSDALLMSPVKSTSLKTVQMKERRQVIEGFLSLVTIERWIVYVCHLEGEWAR